MIIDWTVSVSDIGQIVLLVIAVVIFVQGIRSRLMAVESEISKLSGVVTNLAVQGTRLDSLDKRVARHGDQIDELQRRIK